MSDKKRWNDPANDGQVDYVKIAVRMISLIMLLALAAVVKIAIANNWLGSISQTRNALGL